MVFTARRSGASQPLKIPPPTTYPVSSSSGKKSLVQLRAFHNYSRLRAAKLLGFGQALRRRKLVLVLVSYELK